MGTGAFLRRLRPDLRGRLLARDVTTAAGFSASPYRRIAVTDPVGQRRRAEQNP